jgi:histone acetyltransferase (RNA polymerase elongator complex component)
LASSNKPFIIPVFIPHAGCPHRCVFCDQQRTTGAAPGLPAADVIEKAITNFLGYRRDPNRRTEISFFGGNFLGLPPNDIGELLGIAAAHVESGAVDGIRFSTRPDTIDKVRLTAIADFPVSTIEIGVQSMDDSVLKLNGRGHTARETKQAVALIRRHTACDLGLQMMIGMAGDSPAATMGSAEQLCTLAPDFVRIYPMLVLKGSVLETWHTQRRYQPLDLAEAVEQTKAVYELFSTRGIPVIRMGLQPSEELNPGAGVVAGPFHPAFGELVRSAVWRDTLEAHMACCHYSKERIIIKVNPRHLSQAKGQKNANTAYLHRRFSPTKIKICGDNAISMNIVAIDNRQFAINTGTYHGYQSPTGSTPGSG